MTTEVSQLVGEIEVRGAGPAAAQLAAFGRAIDEQARKSQVAARATGQHDAAIVQTGRDAGPASDALGRFAKTTRDSGTESETTSRKVRLSDTSLRTLSRTALVTGAGLAAGFGVATAATIGFDKAMSGVNAVADVNTRQLGRLRQAAIDAGRDTAFSASEAAQAEAELVKAGVSTRDVLAGGLRGALDLAAAGKLDLANAATITAQALNVFDLRGEKAAHVADVLAAGANRSAADVGQLGDALRQGGLLARQTGLDLEDTVGVLALFADNALIGSDAGTSLKTMLQRLTPQSAEARDLMRQLGIEAYDAQGSFIGLDKWAGRLRQGLKDLTPEQRNAALATIFGSDAVRAANIIYEAGEKGIRGYTKAVDDQGAASRMAGKQMDNLAGDLEELRGSVETALIGAGSKGTGVLRGMTQAATGLVNEVSDLPGPLQTVMVTTAGLGGVTLTTAGAVGELAFHVRQGVGALSDFRAWMATSSRTGTILAGTLKGLGIAAAGVAAFAVATDELEKFDDAAKEVVKTAKQGLDLDTSGGIDTATARLEKQLAEREAMISSYSERFGEVGTRFAAGVQAIMGGIGLGFVLGHDAENLTQARTDAAALNQELDRLYLARNRLIVNTESVRIGIAERLGADTSAAKLATGAILEHARALGVDLTAGGQKGDEAVRSVVAAMVAAASTAPSAEAGVRDLSLQADAASESVRGLSDALFGLSDAQLGVTSSGLSVERAQINLEQAQAAKEQAILEHGIGSREARDADLALREAFVGLAQAQERYAQSAVRATIDQRALNETMSDPEAREGVIRLYNEAALRYPAVAELLRPYVERVQWLIDHPEVTTTFHAETTTAEVNLDRLLAKVGGYNRAILEGLVLGPPNPGKPTYQGALPTRAAGGRTWAGLATTAGEEGAELWRARTVGPEQADDRGLVWVGVDGPEVVDWRAAGEVIPHDESMRLVREGRVAPPGKQTLTVGGDWQPPRLPRRDRGGRVWPGLRTTGGERGAELARLTSPTFTVPGGSTPDWSGFDVRLERLERLVERAVRQKPPLVVNAEGVGDMRQLARAIQQEQDFQLAGG